MHLRALNDVSRSMSCGFLQSLRTRDAAQHDSSFGAGPNASEVYSDHFLLPNAAGRASAIVEKFNATPRKGKEIQVVGAFIDCVVQRCICALRRKHSVHKGAWPDIDCETV